MKFVLLDNIHFKRKRSHKIERSLNCTKWKSAFILHGCSSPTSVMNRMLFTESALPGHFCVGFLIFRLFPVFRYLGFGKTEKLVPKTIRYFSVY